MSTYRPGPAGDSGFGSAQPRAQARAEAHVVAAAHTAAPVAAPVTAPVIAGAHGTDITPAQVTTTYRHYAPVYDWVFGAVLEPGRRALAAAVSAEKPANLLEVGVGTGLLLPQYPAQTAITGIDLSPEMLEKAQQRANAMPERNIRLQHSNGETLGFPAASFDCVTIPYVLSVTPDPARLMAEALRVCKPGGSIYVVNHFSGSRSWWLLERVARPLAARIGFRSDFDFKKQMLDRGWQIESVRTVNLFGLSKLVLIRNA